MPRKGKRRKIATNVFEDATGRAIIGRDPETGRQKELRFDKHTPVAYMRAEWTRWEQSRRPSKKPAPTRGTLAAAIDTWGSLERHLASWKERRAELRAWAALYGSRKLHTITSDDVRRAMSLWATDDVSPKTIRNRLWTLKHLFHVLRGKGTSTPVDHVDPPAVPRQIINPTPVDTILYVYGNLLQFERVGRLRDAKTRARFMVRAATGRRPVEIMRAQPEDVDLERRVWRVRDAKGGWSEPMILNDDMLTAWQTFVEADAWGAFNTGSMAEVLRAAGWPEHSRPYNLRHSLGISLSESGVDFADVAGMMGHTDVRTTRRNYVPTLNSRMARAAAAIDGRFSGWVPVTVPAPEEATGRKVKRNNERPKPRNRARNAS